MQNLFRFSFLGLALHLPQSVGKRREGCDGLQKAEVYIDICSLFSIFESLQMSRYTCTLMLSIVTFYLLATFFLALLIVTRYLYHVSLHHHCLPVTRCSFVATNILSLSSYLTRYLLLALHKSLYSLLSTYVYHVLFNRCCKLSLSIDAYSLLAIP